MDDVANFSNKTSIKGGSRKRKLELIEEINQEWIDLYEKIIYTSLLRQLLT
ncbi:hypothetical protein [Rickettsia endosymbiont of Nabis limbatus]|uniref:hypothetical protein n=1 Tax=Rickettsia endosymbiont of Nabis limbatus TaxID=3066268 RepID=UPI003AF3F023